MTREHTKQLPQRLTKRVVFMLLWDLEGVFPPLPLRECYESEGWRQCRKRVHMMYEPHFSLLLRQYLKYNKLLLLLHKINNNNNKIYKKKR